MDKSLKDKAIKFKGKDYVLVADRVNYFNEEYKDGGIKTELISPPEADRVIVKATVCPDTKNPVRVFTGYSQAKWSDSSSFVNKMSALENAETSAVGRALALMGIGVIDSIASIDEIRKTEVQPKSTTTIVVKGKDGKMTTKEIPKADAEKLIADGKLKIPGSTKPIRQEKDEAKEEAVEEAVLDEDIPIIQGEDEPLPSEPPF